jgi:hypothetical protein
MIYWYKLLYMYCLLKLLSEIDNILRLNILTIQAYKNGYNSQCYKFKWYTKLCFQDKSTKISLFFKSRTATIQLISTLVN